jgi:hypothetical protein
VAGSPRGAWAALCLVREAVARARPQPRTPSAPIAGRGRWRGHRASHRSDAGPLPRCWAGGAMPVAPVRRTDVSPSQDRPRRRAARQPHVAHANPLVSSLFRGGAPDNREFVRLRVCGLGGAHRPQQRGVLAEAAGLAAVSQGSRPTASSRWHRRRRSPTEWR